MGRPDRDKLCPVFFARRNRKNVMLKLRIFEFMQYLEKEQVIYSRKGIGNFVWEDSVQNLQGQMVETQVRDFVEKMVTIQQVAE